MCPGVTLNPLICPGKITGNKGKITGENGISLLHDIMRSRVNPKVTPSGQEVTEQLGH